MAKVKILPTNKLASSTYLPWHLKDGILVVDVNGGQRTQPNPGVGDLYPAIIYVYDDSSIMEIEIFVRGPQWRIKSDLEAPKFMQVAQIIITARDKAKSLSNFWFNPDHSLLFIESTSIGKPVEPIQYVNLTEQIIVSIAADDTLVGLWLLDLPPEVIKFGLSEIKKR